MVTGISLGSKGQLVEFPAGEGFGGHVLIFPKDPDAAANGHGRALVVTSDHNNSDASLSAQLYG